MDANALRWLLAVSVAWWVGTQGGQAIGAAAPCAHMPQPTAGIAESMSAIPQLTRGGFDD